MSDIAKCRGLVGGRICADRNRCRRYTEPSSSHWQSWLAPTVPCEHFLKQLGEMDRNIKSNAGTIAGVVWAEEDAE